MDSRRKGHQYERDTASWYRSLGWKARRGWQAREGADDPDVIVDGLSWWIECKRVHGLGLVGKAWEQAVSAANGAPPVLHVKADRGPDLVVIDRQTWGRLIADG